MSESTKKYPLHEFHFPDDDAFFLSLKEASEFVDKKLPEKYSCERDYIVRRYYNIFLKKEMQKEPVLLSYYPKSGEFYSTFPQLRRDIPVWIIGMKYEQSIYAKYLVLVVVNMYTQEIEDISFKFYPESYEPGVGYNNHLGIFGVQWRPLTFMETVALESLHGNEYIRVPIIKGNPTKSVEDHVRFAKETFGWEKSEEEFKSMSWTLERMIPDESTGNKGLYFSEDCNSIFESTVVNNPHFYKIYEL